MNKIEKFIHRLSKCGIKLEMSCNYPWVYIDKINGKQVIEKFRSEHNFTAFFMPIRADDAIKITDRTEIFRIIRKYV